MYNCGMAIRLALFSEKDIEGNPALFVMLSSFLDNENPTGLGAQRRTFLFTGHLIQALEPTQLPMGFLQEIATDLERGGARQLELTNEQAWDIGVLPQHDGFQWVRTTIGRVRMGDGSFRFCETHQVGDRTVHGAALEELPELGARVRNYVALDWKAIEEQLATRDACGTVQHLPVKTVQYIFDGEL
jgi:hypothetical protein